MENILKTLGPARGSLCELTGEERSADVCHGAAFLEKQSKMTPPLALSVRTAAGWCLAALLGIVCGGALHFFGVTPVFAAQATAGIIGLGGGCRLPGFSAPPAAGSRGE